MFVLIRTMTSAQGKLSKVLDAVRPKTQRGTKREKKTQEKKKREREREKEGQKIRRTNKIDSKRKF